MFTPPRQKRNQEQTGDDDISSLDETHLMSPKFEKTPKKHQTKKREHRDEDDDEAILMSPKYLTPKQEHKKRLHSSISPNSEKKRCLVLFVFFLFTILFYSFLG